LTRRRVRKHFSVTLPNVLFSTSNPGRCVVPTESVAKKPLKLKSVRGAPAAFEKYDTDEIVKLRAPTAMDVGRRMRRPDAPAGIADDESIEDGGAAVAGARTSATDAIVVRLRPNERRPAARCTVSSQRPPCVGSQNC
jgi:hypothetical protein